MLEVTVKETLNLDADTVWSRIGGFNDIPKWNPQAVPKSEVDGDGVGSVRTLTLAQGGAIRERLEEIGSNDRYYRYSLLEGPLPVRDYRAKFSVTPAGAGTCEVEWSASFKEAEGFPPEKAEKIVTGMFKGGIDAMRKTLGAS